MDGMTSNEWNRQFLAAAFALKSLTNGCSFPFNDLFSLQLNQLRRLPLDPHNVPLQETRFGLLLNLTISLQLFECRDLSWTFERIN